MNVYHVLRTLTMFNHSTDEFSILICQMMLITLLSNSNSDSNASYSTRQIACTHSCKKKIQINNNNKLGKCCGIRGVNTFGCAVIEKYVNSNSSLEQATSHYPTIDHFPITAHPCNGA